MHRCMVKSKIHRVTVTGANLNYQGSITIDKRLMDAADILPFEFVHVNSLNSGVHWETYAIPGGDGVICLNGPPARHFQPGDLVVIMGFCYLQDAELNEFQHIDVLVNKENEITSIVKDYYGN